MEKRGNRGNFPQFPRFFNVSLPAKGVSPGPAGRVWFHQKGGLCGKGPGIGVQPGASGFLQPLHGGKQVISVAAECLGSQPDKAGLSVRWIMHLIADPGAGIRIGRAGNPAPQGRSASPASSAVTASGVSMAHRRFTTAALPVLRQASTSARRDISARRKADWNRRDIPSGASGSVKAAICAAADS